jgi:hypothetical protein
VNLCVSPCIYVLGPVVAREHWGGALAWLAVITANAVGLVLGSFLALRLRPARPLLVATLATFGFLPPFFLLAVHAPVWLAASSMLVSGASADVFEVLWQHPCPVHPVGPYAPAASPRPGRAGRLNSHRCGTVGPWRQARR